MSGTAALAAPAAARDVAPSPYIEYDSAKPSFGRERSYGFGRALRAASQGRDSKSAGQAASAGSSHPDDHAPLGSLATVPLLHFFSAVSSVVRGYFDGAYVASSASVVLLDVAFVALGVAVCGMWTGLQRAADARASVRSGKLWLCFQAFVVTTLVNVAVVTVHQSGETKVLAAPQLALAFGVTALDIGVGLGLLEGLCWAAKQAESKATKKRF